MARSKYKQEKRQKELARKKKKDEKRQRKLNKDEIVSEENTDQAEELEENQKQEDHD